MRLIKAQVKNYRSIIDTGEFDVDEIKTVFVGINEAGKTAILKALHQLNAGSDIEKPVLLRDFPRAQYASYVRNKSEDDLNKTPLVKGWYSIEQTDIDEILDADIEIPENINLLQCSYEYDKRYGYAYHSIQGFNKKTWNDIENDVERLIHKLTQINNTDCQQLIKKINEIKPKSLNSNIEVGVLQPLIKSAEMQIDEDDKKEIDRIKRINLILKNNHAYNEILSFLSENKPKFIYFNNYIKVKPIIHLQQLAQREQSQSLNDEYYDYGNLSLLKFIGYSANQLSQLGTPNNQENNIEKFREKLDDRDYKLNAASIELTKKIREIWNPDHQKDEASKLNIKADGQYLKVVVEDEVGVEVELDQRSEGFQWMTSFFIVFSSQANADFKNCILLLDEPATSLHALKQKEFIKTINRLAKDNQILFTTHSPFMISQDELDLVRIVELTDRNQGTKVNNKIISNDPAALFPLQEALGYSLAQSMFTAKKNVLLEGLTDLWYLEGINSLCEKKLDEKIALLPVGYSSKISYYANILYNNELKIVALLDSDGAGDKAANEEILVYTVGNKNILRVADFCSNEIQGSEVEDIIRNTLFKVFSNYSENKISEEDKKSSKSLVDILKKADKNFSKYKLAKEFLKWSKEHNINDLEESEKNNCQKLVDTINKRLS